MSRATWIAIGVLLLVTRVGFVLAAISPKPVALGHTAAPGAGGAQFAGFYLAPTIDQADNISFVAGLILQGGVTELNDEGIWSGTASNFSLIAREGSAISGATN